MIKESKMLLTILFLIILTSPLFSQSRNIQFDYLTMQDGLSSNIVNDIVQDPYGYIWIGTNNGLCRYDGREITTYLPDADNPKSIQHNNIQSLLIDHQGILWIGTFGGGLISFNIKKNIFKNYRHDPFDSSTLSGDDVITIFEDSRQQLWIGSLNGPVNRFQRKTEKFLHGINDSFTISSVGEILEDEQNNLWFGTLNQGIYKYNPKNSDLQIHLPQKDISGLNTDLLCLNLIAQNTLLIGSYGDGLIIYHPDQQNSRYKKIKDHIPNSFTNNIVTDIIRDQKDRIWISTRGNGLAQFDIQTRRFLNFRKDEQLLKHLSNDKLTCLFQDRSNVIWIGTEVSGICKFDQFNDNFTHYFKKTPGGLNHSEVFSFLESHNGNLWVATMGGGINILDRTKNKFSYLKNTTKNNNILPGNDVKALYKTKDNHYWVGTDNSGIGVLDSNKKMIQLFNMQNNKLDNNSITSFYQSKNGKIWIGSWGGGLMHYLKETNQFKNYSFAPNAYTQNIVTCITGAEDDKLWIATYGKGLGKFDPDSETFIFYQNIENEPNSISHNYIMTLFRENSEQLWIGTAGGGLDWFDPVEEKFIHYTTDDGLANNTVNAICQDDHGFLWISTANGLSQFDPVNQTFTNYSVDDGLQGNNFNMNAYCQLKTRELCFGGNNGFSLFNPHHIELNNSAPNPIITGIKIFNQPIDSLETKSTQKSHLPVFLIDKLELEHSQNVITFTFSAMHYSKPQTNLFQCKMKGLDKNWIDLKNKNSITYAKIPPGEYTFQLKCSNHKGQFNPTPKSILIKIYPPYWKTKWFQFIIILFSLATIVVIFKIRVHAIKARKKLLEKKVEERTQEIQEKNKKMESDLDLARTVQNALLTTQFPFPETIETWIKFIPSEKLSGDFYDIFRVDENHAVIYIGDVSGHGVASSMVSIVARNAVSPKKITSENHYEILQPQEVIENLNRSILKASFKNNEYLTFFYGILNIKTLEFTYSCASFQGVYRLIQSDPPQLQKIYYNSFAIGWFHDHKSTQKTIQLEPDDKILLVTDGVLEASNDEFELYEEDRLEKNVCQSLKKLNHKKLSNEIILDQILFEVEKFSTQIESRDDITMILIHVKDK